MRVRIKYYAKYRDSVGKSEEELDIGEMTVRDLLAFLRSKYPSLRNDRAALIALNNNFQNEDAILSDGDTLSVFPPVSGG